MGVKPGVTMGPTAKPIEDAPLEHGQRSLGVTVLFHPDVSRIGDIAYLAEIGSQHEAHLSRSQPEFVQPGGYATGPLANSVLSRQPIEIRAQKGGGVRVSRGAASMEVEADGSPLGEMREFAPEDIARGVVLELAKRVVVLLHFLEPATSVKDDFGLIGYSAAMQQVRDEIGKVANLDVPVLLRGESGVGKEIVARAIHNASNRRNHPYVTVNMAAIPPTIAATELFGHAKGAFTHASAVHKGYFEQAERGTLFLDEVGDTPHDVQTMLLRAIEQREIQMVGSQSVRTVDVRLIAATDSDLELSIEQGSFRMALKQRLQEYEICIPPLRARREDVGRLFLHFLREMLEEVGELHRLDEPPVGQPTWPPAWFVARMARGDWPGNVRQLRTLARRMAIANRGSEGFTVNRAVEKLLEEARVPGKSATSPPAVNGPSKPRPLDITENQLQAVLQANDYRVRPAADELGVSPTSLYTLMQRFGIPTSQSLLAEDIEKAVQACGGDLDRAAERLRISRRALRLRMKELDLG